MDVAIVIGAVLAMVALAIAWAVRIGTNVPAGSRRARRPGRRQS